MQNKTMQSLLRSDTILCRSSIVQKGWSVFHYYYRHKAINMENVFVIVISRQALVLRFEYIRIDTLVHVSFQIKGYDNIIRITRTR